MQDVNATAESDLARRLGTAVGRFVELFGADWRPVNPYDRQHDRDETRHIAGDPPQLMLAVVAGGVILARPRGRWDGVADLRGNRSTNEPCPTVPRTRRRLWSRTCFGGGDRRFGTARTAAT